jgi:hypothetical protein
MANMNNEDEQHPMRLAIESVNNFLRKQKETKTRQLDDNTEFKNLGEPIRDVKMNQLADELGSDGNNAPTVSVTAGAIKGGYGPETGQPKAQFHNKTKLAENEAFTSTGELRKYIAAVLEEQINAKLKEEKVEEAVDELLHEPIDQDESDSEVAEGGRSHPVGKGNNLKPQNYPENLKR